MAAEDEPTEVWSDGTPMAAGAPQAAARQPVPPPPPASQRGPPIWLIGGGALVLVLLAIVLIVQVAHNMRPQVASAAAQFGLIGVWSADCSQPVSPDNSSETFAATADGAVSDTINMGPLYKLNQYRWGTGHLIGDDQIAFDGVFLGDGSAMHVVLQKGSDGRFRTFQATDGAGKKQVVDGAFPTGGAPSWQSKCSGG